MGEKWAFSPAPLLREFRGCSKNRQGVGRYSAHLRHLGADAACRGLSNQGSPGWRRDMAASVEAERHGSEAVVEVAPARSHARPRGYAVPVARRDCKGGNAGEAGLFF